ncbi:TetR/AcrR family transcriptional regulator [Paenibacillus sp. 481]|uniref:TetR/AcrR family transcriptional regulator n=1 Tax=Paenibacillus sp. 481 TaxID=2835869 RepID=UPI001E28B8AB|nr:TetR/AcrR family transcriptional regulator [Paenibacillus sp. 481]UHA73639.1 TetR family transcriptional regulator [Paenibacillus sp. 481]
MSAKAEKTNNQILKAAVNTILNDGINALTLEAVAKKAGVSKGGLLYHFPNKESLIKSMVTHILNEFMHSFQTIAAQDPVEKGKWCRAYIQASKLDLTNQSGVYAGMLAASAHNPSWLTIFDDSLLQIRQTMEQDGIDPVSAAIITTTIDGLYYAEMVHLTPISSQMREHIFQRLMEMTA